MKTNSNKYQRPESRLLCQSSICIIANTQYVLNLLTCNSNPDLITIQGSEVSACACDAPSQATLLFQCNGDTSITYEVAIKDPVATSGTCQESCGQGTASRFIFTLVSSSATPPAQCTVTSFDTGNGDGDQCT